MFSHFIKSSTFRTRLKILKNSQYQSKVKIKNYQTKEFLSILNYAVKNVKFYRDYFKINNLNLSQFKTLNDIKKLPIINKSIIKKNANDFISDKFNKKDLFYRTTGGSTGSPLKIYYDKVHKCKDLANTFFYMSIANNLDPINFKNIRLYGDKIKVNTSKKIFWKKENKNKFIYSTYHIDDDNIIYYYNHINKFKPKYIHGRPSSIILFSETLKRKKLNINFKLDCIFLDGEVLTRTQRIKIEKTLNTKVYLTYGHTEGALLGFSCGISNNIHFAPQVGIVEIIKNNKKDKNIGEIIVTGFNNKAMPLIRYNTEDLAKVSTNKCICKRNYICVKEVLGRTNSYVLDKHRNKYLLAPIIFNYNEIDWSIANKFKFIQNKVGELLLLVDLNNNQDKLKIQKIANKIKKILFNKFIIKVKFTNKIEFTKRGKFNYVEQNIK